MVSRIIVHVMIVPGCTRAGLGVPRQGRVYQGKGMVMAVKNRFVAGAATPQPFLAIVPYPTVLHSAIPNSFAIVPYPTVLSQFPKFPLFN